MKKRTIEKIPYLGLPKLIKRKQVRYAAVTAVEEIGQEKHLITEVYRNKAGCRKVPVARIVVTAKDFGTYFPDSGTWSRTMIYTQRSTYPGLAWRKDDGQRQLSEEEAVRQDIIYSMEDMGRIQEFTQDVTIWGDPSWWEYIKKKQERIINREYQERTRRKYARRRQALEDRKENTPELPEKHMLRYADTALFHEEHHLYYKKHGGWASVACSECGGVTDARWKPGQSYESQFERIIEEPRMNYYGTCPMCGANGKYIPQGREKGYRRAESWLFLGQKYKKDGMVFRYINIGKEWQVGMLGGENGEEMYNAREELSGIEIARVYFEPGKKIQKDYHKHDPCRGEDYWDDCNLFGMANISIREARIMPETFKNMEGTFLQYSALQEYQEAAGDVNPVVYLERYIQMPQLEALVKMGLTGVTDEIVKYGCGIAEDRSAKRADVLLGIRKERVKLLIQHRGDIGILNVMKAEKRAGEKWTDRQIEQIRELRIGYAINTALKYMGIQKYLNRVSKYAGCEYGTGCAVAESRLNQTALAYIDYLEMREGLGYDMHNTVYLFPKDLAGAHRKMVMEHNKSEADRRIREVNGQYPLIRKHYRSLRKKFYFEDEEFMIRPARDAGEIVMEGRVLHHCVGSNSYLERHNAGKSIILFLRDKKDPEIPYITVEITEALDIRQWYGERDGKPDEKRMQKWLDNYVTWLKCGGASMEAQEETGQRILIYA